MYVARQLKFRKKTHRHGLQHLQSNGISQVVSLLDLDLHFKVQNLCLFANISQMVKYRTNITIAIRLEPRYLPLNGAITNVVHRELALYSQDHPISGIIFL